MKTDWSDLHLFLALAEGGSLAQAAQKTGKSQATLGRHMTRLESAVGKRLFQRGAAGYALAADGRTLLDLARDMRRNAQAIEAWAHKAPSGPRRVRITAGTWTSLWLCAQLPRIWSPEATWIPEFVTTTEHLDIARRFADIGIRNARPTQSWLAGRSGRRVRFAAYGKSDGAPGWIAVAGQQTASSRWIETQDTPGIVTTASTGQTALAMARAGLGRVVLPTFTEELDLGVVPLSRPIADLDTTEWLVSHHEARHDPPIRAALDAIASAMDG
jgi:DNA-binding transcriptional LysR family regulator